MTLRILGVVAVFCLFIIGGVNHANAQSSFIPPPTLRIAAAGDTWVSFGTASFVTNDGYIVTDAHVISTTGVIRPLTFYYNGRKYDARLVKLDYNHDLALLKVNMVSPCLSVANEEVQLNKAYRDVQYNWTGGYTTLEIITPYAIATTLNYLGYPTNDSGNKIYLIKAHLSNWFTLSTIRGGNSGSPLLNSSNQIIELIWGGNNKSDVLSSLNSDLRSLVGSLSCAKPLSDPTLALGVLMHPGAN